MPLRQVIGKWKVFIRDSSGLVESCVEYEARDEVLSQACSSASDFTIQRIEGPNGEIIAREEISQAYVDWFLRP